MAKFVNTIKDKDTGEICNIIPVIDTVNDNTLKVDDDGVLKVNTATVIEESDLPITARAVYEALGDINSLLDEI